MHIDYSGLAKIREKYKNQKIVFCSGTFDLLHAGHVLFLENCRRLGDLLVVGIGDDEIIKRKSPDRPILNQHLRVKMVDSLKIVDYCFIHKNVPQNEPVNLFVEEILELLRPQIWVINDDAIEIPLRQKIADNYGVTLAVLKRECPIEFEGISTTGIINKIRS